jgi:histidine ammonia-lyase
MLQLNGQQLTLQQIVDVAEGREKVALAAEARARVEQARQVVQDIVTQGRTVYGVNTGFGKLSDVSIDRADLMQLQLNLVRSHDAVVARERARRGVQWRAAGSDRYPDRDARKRRDAGDT